jgi:ribosomal protein S18
MSEETKNKSVVRSFLTEPRFPGARGGDNWVGPLIDYKEVELVRRQLTSSSKLMSRKRTGANTQEQRALKQAVKRARYLGLIPYSGT